MYKKEYIEREAAMLIVKNTCGDYAAAFASIGKLPAADVAPVKHGEWQDCNGIFRCPKCGYSFEHEGYKHFFHFCPSCGVRMDGEKNET